MTARVRTHIVIAGAVATMAISAVVGMTPLRAATHRPASVEVIVTPPSGDAVEGGTGVTVERDDRLVVTHWVEAAVPGQEPLAHETWADVSCSKNAVRDAICGAVDQLPSDAD